MTETNLVWKRLKEGEEGRERKKGGGWGAATGMKGREYPLLLIAFQLPIAHYNWKLTSNLYGDVLMVSFNFNQIEFFLSTFWKNVVVVYYRIDILWNRHPFSCEYNGILTFA